MRTMSINMMGNKLIGQSLPNKKQKDKPAMCICKYMHVSCCCFIRNTFVRFATAFVTIRKLSLAFVTIVKQICKDLKIFLKHS